MTTLLVLPWDLNSCLYLVRFSGVAEDQLIMLPSGDADQYLPAIRHTLQLVRLGSRVRESPPDDEPPIVRSQSVVGSPGETTAGSPPVTCALSQDETELDMIANVEPPKRTRSRLSLPARKVKSIKNQPLHRPEASRGGKLSSK